MSADDATGKVTTRLNDPELASALEDAADEVGSKSEIVRTALRETLLAESEEDVDAGDRAGDVPLKAQEGHQKLVEYVGVGGHIELEAAESIVANHLNIATTSVRQVVTRPLVNAGWLSRQQGVHQVAVVVRDPDAENDEPAGETVSVPPHIAAEARSGDVDADDADDVETAGDRLDELVEAVEEVRDE